MLYNYKCGNKIINVFVYSDNFHSEVTVHDNKINKSFKRTIREDENGKFFTWNKNKIYINDWIKISMKEFKEKIKNKNIITSDILCQVILSEGVDNVKFLIQNYHDNNYTLFKIKETYNRKIKQNYKIHLVSTELNNICEKDFYTTDMISLVEDGIIKIVV